MDGIANFTKMMEIVLHFFLFHALEAFFQKKGSFWFKKSTIHMTLSVLNMSMKSP